MAADPAETGSEFTRRLSEIRRKDIAMKNYY
jgi:hypothetical protein